MTKLMLALFLSVFTFGSMALGEGQSFAAGPLPTPTPHKVVIKKHKKCPTATAGHRASKKKKNTVG